MSAAAGLPLRVTEAGDGDRAHWQAYTDAHPEASFCHRWEWRALMAEQWRHRPVYLIARRGEAVCGVLPLAHMRTRLFGSQLVSLPFCVYGGPIADDPAALAALDEACRSALPAQQATCAGRRFSMLLDARRVADAVKAGEEILRDPANPKQPAGLAWALATAVPGDASALAFALRAAEASDRALAGKDAMVGAILARVQFLSGDRELAAKTAKRALQVADSPDVRRALEEDVRVYSVTRP